MIRDAASQRQVQAADPAASTWVAANAGSGKTRVLTDRVARLLLRGVDPQNILCLTYTKAGASEMQNRLFRRLGGWAMLPEDALRDELRTLGVEDALGAAALADARRLFARAIETPGGLRIQTIHSFCASLLRRFPLEAGISPQFAEMEEKASILLRLDTVDEMAADPEAAPLVDGFASLVRGDEIAAALGQICDARRLFERPCEEAELRAALGLRDGLDGAGLLAEIFGPGDRAMLDGLAALCAAGSAADVKASVVLRALSDPPRIGDLPALESLLLYGEKAQAGPYTAKVGAFPTKKTRTAADPDTIDALEALMERVEAARPDRQRLGTLRKALALQAFAQEFLRRYDAAKLRRGVLDFDDLIGKAQRLLTDPLIAQWVLFRLDGGIDHILVDESQDTSPTQWVVIERLAAEFGAGIGARADRERTLFVVGDRKQSIYSFQGADPAEFDRMKAHFGERLAAGGEQLVSLALEHSFRSAAEVLRIVDRTFEADPTGLGDAPMHLAFHPDMPGRVDIWPPQEPDPAVADDRKWYEPLDLPSPADPQVMLAEKIAAEILRMTREETIPERRDGVWSRRRVTEGDVLILFQRRSPLFHHVIRACKRAGLDVAGADLLELSKELAIRDLTALLRVLTLPEDDLSLATALKSPLFGWTEQQLFTLAHGRPGYLWQRLRERREDHRATWDILQDLRDRADYLRPFDLLSRILGRHDGRAKLIARLGPEAEDSLDQLLSLSLKYEQQGVPGLTHFLEWLETEEPEVKRQVDSAGGRLRVMTVHGAKGLEAPVVILPDTVKRQARGGDGIYDMDGLPLWAPNKADMPPEMLARRDGLIEAEGEERRRLLYVAMTRAESWLIVCAAGKAGEVAEGTDSWHAQIMAAMDAEGVPHAFPTGEGRRVARAEWDRLPLVERRVAQAVTAAPLSFGPAERPVDPRPLSPSDLGGAKILPGEASGGTQEESMALGSAVHLLLEHLPGLPPERRAEVGISLLQALPDAALNTGHEEIVADVIALLGRPELAQVFAPETLAEVPLTAEGPQGRRLVGIVDRLIVTPGKVTAIDFKTNRIAPDHPDSTPEGLLRQMGAYRHALLQMWADREVETAILWTATGRLMVLSPDIVMPAWQRASAGLTP
ncbi:double-strand break repair helicase AddA [Wenxinia marina]|uniref:DNA 3'-5' helicase n=1 Tax=Wenxinia marina DSM 24838 TaxID=1123501 RepID=A0A0D0Q9H7_9RHOB|nr:double-strand break repair helicase AddA [Wenxinia marina]KIQ71079.1 DNA helicase/exodeoxyribonuclease V, subunit A [Wenxinia marina DSM 24838]GGL55031.1 double-strand break repair helicase AddA [Wenxinia marina]